ncbi:MAG: P-II family nitrogen regulator [Desulfovibrionaceae bacterium]|nr:P-II family nitrogen regulator [Desulfovibrionaceae bacterium]MBR5734850.1 P-II family nitrogen regulator [Desulfovibrionaceae bacterium]
MKILIACIRPERLHRVKAELFTEGIYAMTATPVLGSGRQKGYTEMYRGVTTQVTLLKKVRLELCLADDEVPKAMRAIMRGAKTGHEGDGIIYVLDAVQGIRIRTEEPLDM